jgi:hypothetical protein
MGLLDLLPTSDLGLQGITPGLIPSANPNSTLHYQSSINNDPTLQGGYPAPSELDLNGGIPSVSPTGQGLPYLDNLPG